MKINDSAFDEKKSGLPKIASTLNHHIKYQSPFSIPNDAEIFRMKEKQKDRKRQEKQKNQKLKIWEKGVKKQGITIKQLNELGKKDDQQPNYQSKVSFIEAAKNAIKNRVKVNEPMHDYISKKRSTLVFQMLIDHKRQKINQFEELTKLHRKGLERAEEMLEEDMENFNTYLNENKKLAREAIKKAEKQTRDKNQKVAVIKEKLEIQADLTGKNMSKKQTLQNLKKYKNFLDSLSPQLNEQERKKKQQKIEGEQNENQYNSSAVNNDDLQSDSEEQHMYFKEPEQLASIFHALEQSNLFLITTLKEIQQEMEEAKSSFHFKKENLAGKKNQLLTSKAQLLKQITQVDEDIEQLKKTTNKDEISDYFAILDFQIGRMSKEAAKEIGANITDQKNQSALQLLKDLEKKIQNQLLALKTYKEEKPLVIRDLEKNCITEKREKKKLKNEEEMEEKALKQKEETSPEREKRKGRPIMTRSIIKKEEKKKQVEVVEPEEEIERRKYLT